MANYILEKCYYFLPIRTLPYTMQLIVGMLRVYSFLLKKELKSTSEMLMGQVNETVMLYRVGVPRYLTKALVSDCITNYIFSWIPC